MKRENAIVWLARAVALLERASIQLSDFPSEEQVTKIKGQIDEYLIALEEKCK